MIIFGVRSPLVVDLEETLLRLGADLAASVSVSGTPRVIDRSKLVELAEFSAIAGTPFISCAFAPQRRAELVEQAQGLGLVLCAALIDPTAVVPRSLRAGRGVYINAGVVIGGMSFLGDACFINRAASLGHHCMLGDYVTIGPGATLAGNIHVGARAVIGAGATILPHVRIGDDAVIAAGAVVRKDVPPMALVAGNPGVVKPFRPRRSTINIAGEE